MSGEESKGEESSRMDEETDRGAGRTTEATKSLEEGL